MKSLPKVTFTRRARTEIRRLLRFIADQPWGKPSDREADLEAAIEQIRRMPTAKPVRRNVAPGLGLRCRYAAPFAIVYAVLNEPGKRSRIGVSIRAVRHWRVRNVFLGVKESAEVDSRSPLTTHADVVGGSACELRGLHQT